MPPTKRPPPRVVVSAGAVSAVPVEFDVDVDFVVVSGGGVTFPPTSRPPSWRAGAGASGLSVDP
ncbi:MAG TPA: hypothetical protein VF541_23045 [Longimicrobium sp.]